MAEPVPALAALASKWAKETRRGHGEIVRFEEAWAGSDEQRVDGIVARDGVLAKLQEVLARMDALCRDRDAALAAVPDAPTDSDKDSIAAMAKWPAELALRVSGYSVR